MYSIISKSWSTHLHSHWFDTGTSLIFLKEKTCSFPQCKLTFLPNSSLNGAIISDKFGINLSTYFAKSTVIEQLAYLHVLVSPLCFLSSPLLAQHHWLSPCDPGTLNLLFWIDIYSYSLSYQLAEVFQNIWLNGDHGLHLSDPRLRLKQTNICFNLRHSIKFWLILLWKTSCAECTPYGNLLNWYHLNGVLKKVNFMLLSLNGICQ